MKMNKKILSLALALCLIVTTVFTAQMVDDVSAAAGDYTTTTFGGDTVEDNEGISVTKYVTMNTTENDDGTKSYDYQLNLEVFTTGTVSSTAEIETPADIVLVLDQSTSMMWPASQADDNNIEDGNIGIVDGSYTIGTYDGDSTTSVYTWTQAETVTATVLPGLWDSDSVIDEELDLTVTNNNGTNNDYVTIGGSNYYYNTEYTNLDVDLWSGDYADEYEAVFGYLYSESRQKDLIEAVADFIDSLDNEAGHRVSIVTYHNEAITEYALTGAANTVTTTDSDGDGIYEYNYQAIIEEVLGWASVSNDTKAGTESADTTTGYTFNLEHSTLTAIGIETAESILANAKYGANNYDTVISTATLTELYDGTGRTQLSVIFTDGIPTQTGSEVGNTDTSGATINNVERSLDSSQDMKSNGVTVFTIGMLNGIYDDYEGGTAVGDEATYTHAADEDNGTSTYYADYSEDTTSGRETTTTYYVASRASYISSFLDLLSSNYLTANTYFTDDAFPNATATTFDSEEIETTYDKNTTTDDDGNTTYTRYYYPINTDTETDIAGTLDSIFETVAGEMTGGATYSLDTTAQVRDVMTAEYVIPGEFIAVSDSSGNYNLDSATNTYYYVGTGGSYQANFDIGLYISYCTGINLEANTTDLTADDYVTQYDSGYYTWSDLIDINGTNAITDEVEVVVRSVYIDPDDSAVYYYYTDVVLYEDNYYANTDTTYTTPLTLSQVVIVQGFDFNNYYVTGDEDKNGGDLVTGDYGAKLIIQFEIEPNSVSVGGSIEDEADTSTGDTIGGNSIETNTAASGVYIQENTEGSGSYGYAMLESFPVPMADIPIEVEVSTEDQTIYLGNAVSVADLVTIDGHTIQGVANQYVTIKYTLYQSVEITEIEYEELYAEDPSSVAMKELTSTNSDGTVTVVETKYYTYVYDDDGNKMESYSVTIEAGESATDATGLYSIGSLIVPTEDTDYIVDVVITPVTEGTVGETVVTSSVFSVYVLYPTVLANDIWVDYATPVNLREDNIIQVVDEDGEITTFDTIRVSWDTTSSYEFDIPEPNNAIPPTVTFGFTARRGIEYTATEFEEYGVREDKEFTITSMTTTSSDGYNNSIYFDLDDYDTADLTTFEVNINRFDLTINKTVEADVYDDYPQSFIFDVEYVGSEFVTTTTFATGSNDFVIFARENDATSIVKLYVDTDGYDQSGNSGTYTIWTNMAPDETYEADEETGYYNITALFFDSTGALNISGDYIDMETNTIYYASAPTTATTPTDSSDTGFVATTKIETLDINDITKNIEVVVDPDMSTVTTTEWYGGEDGTTRYYTFSAVVTELYCGIEMTVTEETDWSWRYEPGFTISTAASTSSTSTVTTTYYEDGSITQETRENVDSYKIADFDEIHEDNGIDLGSYTGDSADTTGAVYDEALEDVDYAYYLTDFSFDTVSYVTTSADAKSAVILVVNSERYLDKNDSTDYSDWERTTEIIYLGASLYYADNIEFNIVNGTITYTNYANENITVYFDDSVYTDATNAILAYSAAYYYDEDGERVNEILTQVNDEGEAELAPATYYQIQYTPETDSYGNYVYDTDGNIVYSETEVYAFQVAEIPYAVPAVYFDPLDVEIQVYNWIDEENWLSYSALVENFYDMLDDPRTE